MLSRNAIVIASTIVIVCNIATAPLAQETFKSAKFLTYSAEAQKSYINSSVIIASLIASQNSRTQADCLHDWSGKHVGGGYQPVIDAMRRYPDDHPSGLILAVLQKACGSFKYVK